VTPPGHEFGRGRFSGGTTAERKRAWQGTSDPRQQEVLFKRPAEGDHSDGDRGLLSVKVHGKSTGTTPPSWVFQVHGTDGSVAGELGLGAAWPDRG